MSQEAVRATELATFGAGCFWGVEAAFRAIPGVVATAVGYAGGTTPNPTYEMICHHGTGHAEVVQVTFDPAQVSYQELLEEFWESHDPTQLNRQGPDVGDQYRSAIFFHNAQQEATARASIANLQAGRVFGRPIVTQLEAAPPFWKAEEYHQQFLEKRGQGSCHT